MADQNLTPFEGYYHTFFRKQFGNPCEFLVVSQKFEDLTGLKSSNLISKKGLYLSAIHSNDIVAYRGAIEMAAETHKPYEIQYRLIVNESIKWIIEKGEVVHGTKPDEKILQGVLIDITATKEAENLLAYRLEGMHIITEISSWFLHFNQDQFDYLLNESLKKIGLFSKVDRTYIFRIDLKAGLAWNTHEWCSEGIESQIDLLSEVENKNFYWSTKMLKAGKPVIVNSLEELPKEAAIDKTTYSQLELSSFVLLPILENNITIGFAGFDSVKSHRKWTNDELNILKLYTDILSRSISESKLKKENRNILSLFHSTIESTGEGILVQDETGFFTVYNSVFAGMAGLPEFDIAMSKEELTKRMESKAETSTLVSYLINYNKNGSGKPEFIEMEFQTFEIQRKKRQVGKKEKGWVWSLRDITEVARTEALLRENEERYAILFSQGNDAILILDYDIIIDCNEKACQLFETNRNELVGKNINSFAPLNQPSGRLSKENLFINTVMNGTSQVFEWQIKTANGHLVDAEVNLQYFDFRGKRYLQAIHKDITNQKRNELLRTTMFDIAQLSNTVNTLDELYKEIHTAISRLLDANNFYIALFDPILQMIHFPYFVDRVDTPPSGYYPIGKGLTEKVIFSGQPVFLTHTEHRHLVATHEDYEFVGEPSKIWLGVPLKVNELIFGAMVVQHYENELALTESDKELMIYVSNQVARVIHKVRTEEEIKESRKNLAIAQQVSKLGSWEWNIETKVFYWSEELYRILGFKPGSIKPGLASFRKVIFDEDYPLFSKAMKTTLKTGETLSCDIRVKLPDRSQRFLIANFEKVHQKNNGKLIVGSIQDITERKIAEIELQQVTNELLTSNKELEQFAYITSHNLRSPIANLTGLVNVLKMNEFKEESINIVIDKIDQSIARMEETIRDLSDVLNIKRDSVAPRKYLLFDQLLRNTTTGIEKLIEESNASIIADFNSLQGMNYLSSHLESIFQNMLTNSIKYRKEGVPPIIKISSHKKGNFACLTFSDNGMGIDLDRYHDRIFGLYQRFHDHVEGKGLGLYIINNQVKALSGYIEVDSKPGKGTTFRIYLEDQPI